MRKSSLDDYDAIAARQRELNPRVAVPKVIMLDSSQEYIPVEPLEGRPAISRANSLDYLFVNRKTGEVYLYDIRHAAWVKAVKKED